MAELTHADSLFVARFSAMGGPCEILADTDDPEMAGRLAAAAEVEAARVERKFSRYLPGNLIDRLNHSDGRPVEVDEETGLLLDYAAACYETSGGMFDVTSGILRRVWRFDGSDRVPDEDAVREILPLVGWDRVVWKKPWLTLRPGMEIDLGGLAKEYAVDHAAMILGGRVGCPFLVNFGGDLAVSGRRRGGSPWAVGVEDPEHAGASAVFRVDLFSGALATSGDARRFAWHRGQRLGHILNPRTGWPVEGAPRSVTVLAPSCVEAGTLSTLAILRGPDARAFLEEMGVQYCLV